MLEQKQSISHLVRFIQKETGPKTGLSEKLFNKKAHIATTHNELIKDKRFVLVGRGLYALAEWGYLSGVVKDVIKKVLDKHGPLPKDEIIQKVLKERFVKENTILVNLQNNKFFKKDKDGRYHLTTATPGLTGLVGEFYHDPNHGT